MKEDTIVGLFLILFGLPLTIWEISVFVRGKQGALGYDVGGLTYGIASIIGGITLLV